MKLMICMNGEPQDKHFLREIAGLGCGIELQSYGMLGVKSRQDWETRLFLHKAFREQFNGSLAMHGPFIGMEYTHIDHLIRSAVRQRLDMTFDAAVQLKAERVILHGGYTLETDVFSLQNTWFSGSVEFWRQEILRWAEAGIQIVLENVTEKSPDLLVRLVNEIDNPLLGLCLDIGHQHVFSQLGPVEWVRRMKDYLFHIHLHDNDGTRDSHLPTGRGTIQFEPFFEALTREAAHSTISLEVEEKMDVKMGNLRQLADRFSPGK
jgi:sugar phosphate isomerase/epimerase